MRKHFVPYIKRGLPILPLAAVAIGALSSGCGSGNGSAPFNPPIVQTSGGVPNVPVITPTPIPSGTPTPGPSPKPTPSPTTPIAPTYTVTSLGDYKGGDVAAISINDAGQVLAQPFFGSSDPVPLLLYTNSTYQPVTEPLITGRNGGPSGLNDAGSFVGSAYVSPGVAAFVVEKGTFRDLGKFMGADTFGVAINDKGQIVTGAYIKTDGGYTTQTRSFLNDNGVVTDLGFLSGSNASDTSTTIAGDLNENGQIVGSSTTSSGQTHAFLWEKGTMRDLSTASSDQTSGAQSVNNKGQAAGFSAPNTTSVSSRAVLFDNGTVQVLNLSVNGITPQRSVAGDINEAGQIVGTYYTSAGIENAHAFLYDHGAVVDLNQYAPNPSDPVIGIGINNKGQILISTTARGSAPVLLRPYVLTPVTKAARGTSFIAAAKPAAVGSASKKR